MDDLNPLPMDPHLAAARFAEMLEEDGLPRFQSAVHDPEIDALELSWPNGFTLHFDLTCELDAIQDWERDAILGRGPAGWGGEPIHVVVPSPVHSDDTAVHHGIPVTSPSRALIDCAEWMRKEELRELFARARATGLLDPDALRASRARVEWRPSLAMLDEVIAEFCDE